VSPNVVEARALLDAILARRLVAVVPALLFTELLNVAARRWQWERTKLIDLVAEWTARGSSAHDACYVALARAENANLVTDDALILSLAPHDAISLETWAQRDGAWIDRHTTAGPRFHHAGPGGDGDQDRRCARAARCE